MELNNLVDKYFNQIEIVDTDFVTTHYESPDAAFLLLRIPVAMLNDYLKLKKQKKKLPDAKEFWIETNLSEKLSNSDKYHGQGHEPLADILEFLEGQIYAEFGAIRNSSKMITLSLHDIPEPY